MTVRGHFWSSRLAGWSYSPPNPVGESPFYRSTRSVVATALYVMTGVACPWVVYLLYRSRRPGPTWRFGRVRRPGAIACLAATVVLPFELIHATLTPTRFLQTKVWYQGDLEKVQVRHFSRGGWPRVEMGDPFFDMLNGLPRHAGFVVAGSWLALILAGTWRPERSWLDRAGRARLVLDPRGRPFLPVSSVKFLGPLESHRRASTGEQAMIRLSDCLGRSLSGALRAPIRRDLPNLVLTEHPTRRPLRLPRQTLRLRSMVDRIGQRFRALDAAPVLGSLVLGGVWAIQTVPLLVALAGDDARGPFAWLGTSRHPWVGGYHTTFGYSSLTLQRSFHALAALLAPPTLTLLILRLRRPRPPLARCFRQPGTTACAVASIVLVLEMVNHFLNLTIRIDLTRIYLDLSVRDVDRVIEFSQSSRFGAIALGLGESPGLAVAGAFLALWAAGIWRSEPDLDRSRGSRARLVLDPRGPGLHRAPARGVSAVRVPPTRGNGLSWASRRIPASDPNHGLPVPPAQTVEIVLPELKWACAARLWSFSRISQLVRSACSCSPIYSVQHASTPQASSNGTSSHSTQRESRRKS